MQEGTVYAVEFSHRSGRDLVNMAKKRTNVIRSSPSLPFPLLPSRSLTASRRLLLNLSSAPSSISPSCRLFLFPSLNFPPPPSAIVEDARHPNKYRMLLSMVDVVFADVAQPDQARIVALNAHHFLKNGGHAVISIKASCIDSTAPAEAVFAAEVKKLQSESFKPREQLTLGAFSVLPPTLPSSCLEGLQRPSRLLCMLTTR